MSSEDLEGDDIWGDGGAGDGEGGGGASDGNPPKAPPEEGGSGGDGREQPAAPSQEEKMDEEKAEEEEEPLEDDETRHMTVGELRQRIHLINNDVRVMKSEVQRITHESRAQRDRIRENQEKVKLNKQLPYLVANVVEVLEPDAEDGAWL
jgi:hypothetical protein